MPSLRLPVYFGYEPRDMTAQNTAIREWRPAADICGGQRSLEVVVLHTTTTATLRNLKTAAELAAGLAAKIRLLVLEVVPYPLEVESPRVPIEFTQRRFRTVASSARVDTLIDIRLGRERRQMLESALKPGSLVVLDGGGWWTRERRLARRLERLGHQVVLTR
jgi:hypothetical protein